MFAFRLRFVPLLVLIILAGCDSSPHLMPNQLPSVTLTSGPVDTTIRQLAWVVDIQWTGTDPDGRIDHFEYTIDPPSLRQTTMTAAETSWVSTRANGATVEFRASQPGPNTEPGAQASDFHVFALRAIDDRGGISPLVVRAFYAYTIAPDAGFTDPRPSPFFDALLPWPARLTWNGDDPDGHGSRRPAFYRILFLNLSLPQNFVFRSDPDSLRKVAIATHWRDWYTVGGDTTSMELPSTAQGLHMLTALVAVDAAGASTPYFSFDRNLLQFQTVISQGPRIHVWSSFVDFAYDSGGYFTDPLREIPVSAPANAPLTFHWSATAEPGRAMAGYRWTVDLASLDDETPRVDEATDWYHWSRLGPGTTSATFGPLPPGVHRLYIEARDDFGGRSLAIVRIDAFLPTFEHDLLVVNDTRLEPDKYAATGCPVAYAQRWPSAAELDTFLFARGNVPWRCTQNPASGVISAPGLFAGYSFDTLGTRLGLENPANGVSPSTLARYRNLVWLLDDEGALYSENLDQRIFPVTALCSMSALGRASTLAAYVAGGGRVWLAGGGAAYASLVHFDRRLNNQPNGTVFESADGELAPGRPLYDALHVRSALAVSKVRAQPVRSPAARGGWSGHGPDGTLSAPDYLHLPEQLRLRTPADDPIPPTRLASQGSLYYPTATTMEYVTQPNSIREDMDPDPLVVRIESTLDTLYESSSPQLILSPAPSMLYYHGRDNAPFVFTGFDLWSWPSADCRSLVDFVLHDVWGLRKSQPSSAGRSPTSPRPRHPGRRARP